MILIAVVGLGFVIGMPYLLDSSMYHVPFQSRYYKAESADTAALQWTQRRGPSSKSNRRRACCLEEPALPIPCRISIWPLGWLERLQEARHEVVGGKSRKRGAEVAKRGEHE